MLPGPLPRNLLSVAARPILRRTKDLSPTPRARNLAGELHVQGITTAITDLVTPEMAAETRNWLDAQHVHDPWRRSLGDFPPANPASTETSMGFYRADQTAAAPHLFDLMNHPLLLTTAELVLNCKPTIDNCFAWWSYTGLDEPRGTQHFHRDVDSLRFIKVFLYLTDVDEQDGPHDYVVGSHRSWALSTTKRISDAEVLKAFGKNTVRSMTGPAGTIFLANTYGIHRGRRPLASRRLVFAGAYTNLKTPHGPGHPVADLPDGYDIYSNRIYHKPNQLRI